MKFKNLTISKQIAIWLGTIYLIVIILAASAMASINLLWNSTSTLYEHPMAVLKAIGAIEIDVLSIHKNMLQFVIEDSQQQTDALLLSIDALEADAYRQFDVLYSQYLGQKTDIDEASNAIAQWKTIRTETIRLLEAGQVEEARSRVNASGIGGKQADKVMTKLVVISDFANNKGIELYNAAKDQRNLNVLLLSLLLVAIAFVLSGIGFYMRKGVLSPLKKITDATEAMRQGDLSARIKFAPKNEFGVLSSAFNAMAGTIETEMVHKDKVANFSSDMFGQDSLRPFCQLLLQNLLVYTHSQIGAIYFVNEENGCFECYESIGIRLDALSSFSLLGKEGEFGTALASKKIQHITNIPSDMQVVFSAVSGDFHVREIITIPIIAGSDVISVISVAGIKAYAPASIRLINSMTNEISSRISALLSSQKIVDFSQKLQSTNNSLQQQAKELEMQSNELTNQNAELEMQKKQLDEANRLKTTFLSNMSHELRTPLNSVIALSGVLSRRLDKKIPEEEYSYLEIIERNGKNLLTLINDVLDISRIEAGREEVEITKFNINSLISEVMAMLQPLAEEKDIEIIQKYNDSDLFLTSDMDKCRHILQNLIGNAVKFTEEGTVTITTQQSGNHMEVKVIDTGIGISAKQLPYVFDEFMQADGSTSRRFGGTGLGLAISQKYAYLLSGTVSVISTVDHGSEFTLSLPLLYAAENKTVAMEQLDSKQPIKPFSVHQTYTQTGRTILLVEDNDAAIIQIKDLVEEMGYQVLTAHDAAEAFEIIDKVIPDAMILDLMMPDIDGFKMLEILRNAEPTAHIPVLILTAKHITKDELKFLKRNNIHELIQKGDVDRAKLQYAISGMLFHEPVEAKPPPQPRPIEGKPVVLVVEDNPDNMITAKSLLSEYYTMLEAVDALQSITLAKEFVPHLILMDIALSGMDGIQAFKEIRNNPELQHIPIIALTASAMTQDRETILSHGFDAFIAKPIIEHEFYKVISEVLYGK